MADLRTALTDWHAGHGGKLVPFGGWSMPVQYAGIVAEHTAVRTAGGLFDIGHMARLTVTGRDALPFLEHVFSNSVATMSDGQVRYGLVLNERGGIRDDVLVYKWPRSFGVVVNAGNRVKILDHFRRHAAGRQVQIDDRTFDTAMIAVQGPKAVKLVDDLFGTDPGGLKYYHAVETVYRGCGATVSRTGYTGEDGFEVSVPNELAVTLWEELLGRGAVACGLGARDTLRLEAAMPLYGHELEENVDPVSAKLMWAVKPDKGEFVGRDAVKAATGNPVRVGIELTGKRAAREGCPVLAGGAPAGVVTSGSYAPFLQKSIAMGYVHPAHAALGTPLVVDIRGTPADARVVPLPFYKRQR
jgi:aminomethyltransferase